MNPDYVVEHVTAKIDCSESEGSSITVQRE